MSERADHERIPAGCSPASALENHGAGTVRIDQAVPIVRIRDSRQRVGTDDHRRLDVARAQHRVGVDDALQPARTAGDDVAGNDAGIPDAEPRLHPRRERRDEIGPSRSVSDVAEVVREDDGAERLTVDSRRFERRPRCKRPEVGRHLVRFCVAPFADPREALELFEDFGIALPETRAAGPEKLAVHEVRIRNDDRRDVRAGPGDDRSTGENLDPQGIR